MTQLKHPEQPNLKRGLLLLNLGTPRAPTPPEVASYLKEFLMDPLVIDIPAFFRWILVKGIIAPRRSVSSAKAYQKVWTTRGSPLLFHLLDLVDRTQDCLGADWIVRPAMRYGSPSIQSVMTELKDMQVSTIWVAPLYPQYSLAATESSIQECVRQAKVYHPGAELSFLKPFFDHDAYIGAFASVIQESLQDFPFDHLIFSFHGLPERQIKKTDPSRSHCLTRSDCCDQVCESNQNCYRAQCFVSARRITTALGISPDRTSVGFQSRLGRTPWIQPFTDDLYRELPKRGVRRLAVACPSFVADCLETLEEVAIRGREEFIENGGQDLKLVPSLNSSAPWVSGLARIVLDGVRSNC